ncbi:hydrogenase expression/formation protein HypE [Pseudomaricurvus alkylphenolicus]|uniref:hydrogenase expression/formation protein HypE n=1 Tax=Pseudomaricurvus alkylphenolicus TaxID=1306991 RepID=UPI0014200737|nr:hydrogenase expression/formation protein HypE [Pseudomaricurvus alkylphenolicus]NIB45013.1 hydrogenase expression/formation protein HypE [Pseudomaricurvus alkylphenolicus]
MTDEITLNCPMPFNDYERVVLAHGGGGRIMHRLINDCFVAAFDNPFLAAQGDGATLNLSGPVAMSTDAFTVSPLFFPGGDIGSLAVHGTANDLAMCAARARYLSVSFILEEGLLLADLHRLVDSMADAAKAAGILIVAGDTKVVEKGRGDGVYITTSGIGTLLDEAVDAPPSPARMRPGNSVIVSGPVGDHGAAIMALREGLLTEETQLASDAGPVIDPVSALYRQGIDVSCLRDPTRGGLATVLCELACASHLGIYLKESLIPVREPVRDTCEFLGLDPMYVACEGRFVAVVAASDQARALQVLHQHGCPLAAAIGEVQQADAGTVVLENAIGSLRVVDRLSGEQLPRIC